MRELFNLMNFLDPEEWRDLDALQKEHEILTEELIKQLHERLRRYFLRRIKSEVLQLPPKVRSSSTLRTWLIYLLSRMKLLCLSPWHHCRRRFIDRF